jgi:hypothetical protein
MLNQSKKEVITMTSSTHADYLVHLAAQLESRPHLRPLLSEYTQLLIFVVSCSLDSVCDKLVALYCPTGQGDPYDPCCMLRSWLMMTMEREHSPDAWAKRLRCEPLLAILAGFVPGHTPCATAHRDFLARFADGPYEQRKKQNSTLSQSLKGQHERRLEDATEERRKEAQPYNSQSEAIVTKLLEQADAPRDPNALQTRLEDLFVQLGLKPTLEAGLLEDAENLIVSGDGTILASAASGNGKKICDCPPKTKDCDHKRLYSSATAQWCYDQHHDTYIFGDRPYTISTHVNGRDLPLITIMGNGNESDFTLCPKAIDDLLKMIREHNLPMAIVVFVGDGHHDALAIYVYLEGKGIIAIIPLGSESAAKKGKATEKTQPQSTENSTSTSISTSNSTSTAALTTRPTAPDISTGKSKNSKTIHPHLERYPEITFDPDGTPLCPGGCRMRYHTPLPDKRAHFFKCPAVRKNRKGERIFHEDECPLKQDCEPDKKMGHTLYIASAANPRLFPPVYRDSKRFKQLYNERTSTERSNSTEDSYKLDHAHRNAVYGLIRLTFVNICKHARVRLMEQLKTHSEAQLFQQALAQIGKVDEMIEMPN